MQQLTEWPYRRLIYNNQCNTFEPACARDLHKFGQVSERSHISQFVQSDGLQRFQRKLFTILSRLYVAGL